MVRKALSQLSTLDFPAHLPAAASDFTRQTHTAPPPAPKQLTFSRLTPASPETLSSASQPSRPPGCPSPPLFHLSPAAFINTTPSQSHPAVPAVRPALSPS